MIKKTIPLLSLALVSSLILMGPCSKAQEKEEKKIHIVITKEVNGEEKTFDKTYKSTEEMLSDPELKAFEPAVNMHKGRGFFEFHSGEDAEVFFLEQNNLMRVHGDEMRKMEEHMGKLGAHFDSLGRVWAFENDGDSILFSFGHGEHFKEMEQWNKEMEWAMKDGMKQAWSADSLHRIMMLKSDSAMHYSFLMHDRSVELDSLLRSEGVILRHLRAPGHPGGPGRHHSAVFIRKSITIADLEPGDAEKKEFKPLINKSKALTLDELSYYPNPNDGRFRLRFKVEEGKELKISIFDISGKEVYGETFNNFQGRYDNDINLSMHNKGIYLLQIKQDGKTVNKKLVIE